MFKFIKGLIDGIKKFFGGIFKKRQTAGTEIVR